MKNDLGLFFLGCRYADVNFVKQSSGGAGGIGSSSKSADNRISQP